MEAEIVRMTANLFGSDEGWGYSTSGGTESIMMGVLAHRNYAAKFKNITEPNMYLVSMRFLYTIFHSKTTASSQKQRTQHLSRPAIISKLHAFE